MSPNRRQLLAAVASGAASLALPITGSAAAPVRGTKDAFLLTAARHWDLWAGSVDDNRSEYFAIGMGRTRDGMWWMNGRADQSGPPNFTLEIDDPAAIAFLEVFAVLISERTTVNGGKQCRWSDMRI